MTEPEEDFAALFEASTKAKRFERGDTIEGTIVAIGPDAAFVNVGGKGEAVIELEELKNEDGVLEVAVGERIQAVVVSTDGGLSLSRKLARGAATARQLEDAFHARLPVEGRVGTGGEGRVRGPHRQAARLLSGVPDRHRAEHEPGGPRGARLHVPHHRVQGGRPEPRRVAARAAGGRTTGAGRRDPPVDRARRGRHRARRLGARLRRVRRSRCRDPGPAPRVRNGVVARGARVGGRHARPGDHRQGAARGRPAAADRARAEAAPGRPVVDGSGQVRGGPGAPGPHHAGRASSGRSSSWSRVSRRWRTCPRSPRRRGRATGLAPCRSV